MIGVINHVAYHLQEVARVLSNRLTKGQTLGTHTEPWEKKNRTKKQKKTPKRKETGSHLHSQIKGSAID